jgi:hypothetical protein
LIFLTNFSPSAFLVDLSSQQFSLCWTKVSLWSPAPQLKCLCALAHDQLRLLFRRPCFLQIRDSQAVKCRIASRRPVVRLQRRAIGVLIARSVLNN